MPDHVVVTSAVLRGWPLPAPGSDKESRGRTLVVGGSRRTPGAVLLAAEAALRSGAGKLQVATVASVAPYVAVALPEALVEPLPETDDGVISPTAAKVVTEMAAATSALLLGPGMTDREACAALVADVLAEHDRLVVLDALALAAVTEDPSCVHRFDGLAVLTPNLTELALTLGVDRVSVEDDVAAATLELARRTRSTVSAGGEESWTARPDGSLWCDQTGGAGLGVSGSGDVLAGIVTGLAARGADPAQAAVWGAHLHGRAGDRLAGSLGRIGYLARELPAEVPRVLAEIEV